ncbi:NOP58 family protein [Candidatus Woesearchaeota archaeon]|nr:NOP58 family protein [Candidatus Woesearchaeota archaeon]
MKLYFVNSLGEYVFEIKKNKAVLVEKKLFSSKQKEQVLEKGISSVKQSLKGETPSAKELSLILQSFKEDAKSFKETDEKTTKKKISEAVGVDTLIIQSVSLIEELEKISNTLAKRIREWYSLYAPEVSKKIGDNEGFVSAILKKDKKTLLKELKTKESMGANLDKKDVEQILRLARTTQKLYEERKAKESYIKELMKKTTPNLLILAGAMIGSKLISLAGGIRQLSLMPASTVQTLGAETALFRHLKTKAKPPKHGVIINHPIIQKTLRKNRGKAARALADKLSICAKVDYFKGDLIAEELRLELEKKF